MPLFAKFDGVDGEVHAQGFERYIELFSFSAGAENAGTHAGGGGGGAGKVNMGDFHFVRPTGKASPTLMLACCNGRHFPSVEIVFVRTSGSGAPETYLKYKLDRCFVKSWSTSGDSGSPTPTDSFSLNFEKITYTQAVDGGVEEVFFDTRTNTGGGGQ